MTFQGDVRGIGLAELLQGLARGRKEGVLTLTADASHRATLGLEGGQLYLLPEPEEDAEMWRELVRDAWAGHPDFRVDDLRMSEVARAHRMERLFGLLDCDGMHFRFEPGALPRGSASTGDPALGVAEAQRTEVHCDGSAVEFILLEYARLADELEAVQDQVGFLTEDVVPYIIDDSLARSAPRFHKAIDGHSTLLEISDRLGWPIRQTRLALWNDLTSDAVRISHPDEMLEHGITELREKRFSRAASRLGAWCREGRPGPVTPTEAEALATEWLAGRLPSALGAMSGKHVRTLLRRLDHTLQNTTASVLHWEEALRLTPKDKLTRLHWMAAQFAEGSNPDEPDLREMLDLARSFSEAHHARRAGPVLVIAAHQQPTSTGQQIELGQGLVSAGRVQEGAPWVMEAARTLLEQGHADRVIAPLRQVIDSDPTNRECRRLLTLAKRSSSTVRKLRKNLLITLVIAGIGASAAIVKVHNQQDFNRRLSEVRALIDNPILARQRLDELLIYDTDSLEVQKLRDDITANQVQKESAKRATWNDIYNEAHTKASGDDPILGLRLALDLPEPPRLLLSKEQWPEQSDLFVSLSKRLQEEIELLGEADPDELEQIQAELDKRKMLVELREMVAGTDMSVGIDKLIAGLDEVETQLNDRDALRARIEQERIEKATEDYQIVLLEEARTHAKAYEFERALNKYRELKGTDPSGRIGKVIDEEVQAVQIQQSAVEEAREFSREGLHDDALRVLEDTFDKPGSFLMPWHVETFPTGASVDIGAEVPRTTPFDIETTFGQPVTLKITLEGFDSLEHDVDNPSHQSLYLSRTPIVSWRGEGRIDAIPYPLGTDYLFVDRKGNLARVDADGNEVWRKRIQTMSGTARAPVPLPGRPGSFLLVTEDGKAQAWIIDGETGTPNGPLALHGEVLAGPYSTGDLVAVRLRNGDLVTFVDRLKPTVLSPADSKEYKSLDGTYRYGSDQGMQVLRRRSGLQFVLENHWNDWVIKPEDTVFRVFRKGEPEGGYPVTLEGQWEYMAWEAPHGEYTQGRLWLSDGTRIRAFIP